MPPDKVLAAARQLKAAQERAKRRKIGPVLASTDADLDALAAVGPANVSSAEALWDEAQRLHKTGLAGLLSADVDDA